MVSDQQIVDQLSKTLNHTNIPNLGEKYEGKVRDCYLTPGKRVLIATDRISCFDVVVSTIPFKGQVLTQLGLYWFEKTKAICANHLISSVHPNVVVAHECNMLPVEVVVRRFLSGTLWRAYKQGENYYQIPELNQKGLREFHRFQEPIITPTTKAPKGVHDMPISEKEIISSSLVNKDIWDVVRGKALELFMFGEQLAIQRNLLLADTKYEFGILNKEVTLADEIHTLDSSRYWQLKSYEETLKSGTAPKMLDKENARQWFIRNGFQGEGVPPALPDAERISLAKLYIDSYENITGEKFVPMIGDQTITIQSALAKSA